MDVAAVILNWNQPELTQAAAVSVLDQVDRVYVVDNGSSHDVLAGLAALVAHERVSLVRNERNLGYASGNNRGIERAIDEGHEAILIMNNDATAEPAAVQLLCERLAQNPGVGAVAPAVVSASDGELLHTHCSLDERTGRATWGERGLRLSEIDTAPRPTGYISGEAFVARREVFARCGGFDERYPYYFEDVDWSVRVRRAGWQLEAVPQAVFRHLVGGTMPSIPGLFHRARSRNIFLRRTLGYSRMAGVRRSAPVELVVIGSLLRRGRIWPALRGELAGWIAGTAARL